MMSRLLVHACALGCALISSPGLAADGDLDPTFGASGTLYLYWPGYVDGAHINNFAQTVLSQPDGKTIVVAQVRYQDAALNEREGIGVARLTVNGQLDGTFGEGATPGELVLLPAGVDIWYPESAALSVDGSIVIVGETAHL